MFNDRLKTTPTDEKEKLRLLNLFTDNMNANVFVADRDGNIIFASKGVAETYECSMDELLNFNAYTMKTKGWVDRDAAVKEVLVTKKAVKKYIKTGKDKGMIISCVPILDEHGDVEYAISTGYNEKDFLDMLDNFDREKKRLQSAISYLNRLSNSELFLQSTNPKMQYIYSIASRAAASDSAVMIYGASGTGKEVLAKHIHFMSPRHDAIFLPINCAAIPDELMESEFFGYEKGSFTGAREKGKTGFFEIASNGTLFLDEIGELSLAMQSKLLRVLESGEYIKIGSDRISKTNARIIGATNKDLTKMVDEGIFREDLYYRLNIIPMHIPDLSERPEDILRFAQLFLQQANEKMGTRKVLSPKTLEMFKKYSWPGNVRELKNMIERMVIISPSDIIEIQEPEIIQSKKEVSFGTRPTLAKQSNEADNADELYMGSEFYELPFKEAVGRFELEYVRRIMNANNGNIAKTARDLNVQRSTIYNILKKRR